MMNDLIQTEIIEKLKQSKKYSNTCDDTIERVVAWAAARHKTPKDVHKAACRKLHQVYGAYFTPAALRDVERLAATLEPGASDDAVRARCRAILECHVSTRERLPILDDVFRAIFDKTGVPSTVLDLAAGLNPFALPWMSLPPDALYQPLDIDRRLIAAVNHFLERIGRPPTAQCRDILVAPPDVEADVVLLLKVLPSLEQQEKGAGLRLLRGLRARHAVISFPAWAMGGRDKGMAAHYHKYMMQIMNDLAASFEQLDFPNEIFYIVRLTS